MANLQYIRDLALKKNITLRHLADKIGISEGGLQKIIQHGRTNTDTLERIAHELQVHVGYFFDNANDTHIISRPPEGTYYTVEGCKPCNPVLNSELHEAYREIAALRERVSQSERLLEEKERTIQILMNKL
jgi:transcriptional regulator with XRE-family HTH domain